MIVESFQRRVETIGCIVSYCGLYCTLVTVWWSRTYGEGGALTDTSSWVYFTDSDPSVKPLVSEEIENMKPFRVFSVRLIVVVLATVISMVHGHSHYQNNIPNGNSVKDSTGSSWAGVGHNRRAGGGALNPFGVDFQNAGHQWTNTLCQKDSDGDGATNGQELGDPNCVWVQGGQPAGPATGHPGFADNSNSAPPPPAELDTCANVTMPAGVTNMTMQFSPGFSLPGGVVTTYPRQAFNLTELAGSGGVSCRATLWWWR